MHGLPATIHHLPPRQICEPCGYICRVADVLPFALNVQALALCSSDYFDPDRTPLPCGMWVDVAFANHRKGSGPHHPIAPAWALLQTDDL